MTPPARIAAAAAILDRILAGALVERALTDWGRASRFAGSGDRVAVRDLVYDAMRRKRSLAALGGGMTGRGLMLGALRAAGTDPATVMTGAGHALTPPNATEVGHQPVGAEALDCPDWLHDRLKSQYGSALDGILHALRERAPVFLRVNAARGDRPSAIRALAAEGIVARPVDGVEHALEVTENARKINGSGAYLTGLVELQDASSQAVVEALPLRDGLHVLDFCAGGGGKTLAMAARARMSVHAHDAAPARMRDLPVRAKRAGLSVTICENPDKSGPYDLILTDVPCSGSGSWRRDPQGKWALTPERVTELVSVQAAIVDRAVGLLRPSAWLAYVTCSILPDENGMQAAAALARHPDLRLERESQFLPGPNGDGFYLALFRRDADR